MTGSSLHKILCGSGTLLSRDSRVNLFGGFCPVSVFWQRSAKPQSSNGQLHTARSQFVMILRDKPLGNILEKRRKAIN